MNNDDLLSQLDFFYEDPNQKWVELFPYGLTMGADQARPLMIFKDKLEKQVLPVYLSPVEAGLVVTQVQETLSHSSPHHLINKILDQLGVHLKKVYFTDVKGPNQFVDLHFVGNDRLKVISSRADEALSFCLGTEAQFYCRPDYFRKCKELQGEIQQVALGAALNPALIQNPHPYLN